MTRLAPARMAMCANASGLPLSSPRKYSSWPVTWSAAAPSAPGVLAHAPPAAPPGARLDQRPRGGEVQGAGGVGVGREGHDRPFDAVALDAGDLAGQPGLGQSGRVDRAHGLRLPRRAEV